MNEPLRRLHPAVVRPGRIWAEVAFGERSVGEGNSWLAKRTGEGRVERATSLAGLSAVADGRQPASRARLGFAAWIDKTTGALPQTQIHRIL